jgi:hypothetical protein
MRTVQLIVRKTLWALILLTGLVLILWPVAGAHVSTLHGVLTFWPAQLLVGLLAVFGGVLGLLPLMKPSAAEHSIFFEGPHGKVSIQLDSVEAVLGKALSKRPEVKRATVRVEPNEENNKAGVHAYVWLHRGEETVGVREMAVQLSNYAADMAAHILGPEELMSVNLSVLGIALEKGAAKRAEEAGAKIAKDVTVAPAQPESAEQQAEPGAEQAEQEAPEGVEAESAAEGEAAQDQEAPASAAAHLQEAGALVNEFGATESEEEEQPESATWTAETSHAGAEQATGEESEPREPSEEKIGVLEGGGGEVEQAPDALIAPSEEYPEVAPEPEASERQDPDADSPPEEEGEADTSAPESESDDDDRAGSAS